MQTVVLAAGEGTRIRPLSARRPKPMLPVADRPLVAHAVDAAIEAGTDEVILVVGYEADTVRDHFGAEYRGVPIRYAEQRDRAGTADAVRQAAEYIDGPFVVLNGDNLYEKRAIAELLASGPALCVVHVDEPQHYGVISTADGVVTEIVEKPSSPPSSLANAGAYAFPTEAVEWLDVPRSERGEYEITDVVDRMIQEYDVHPVELERWLDVGRPWELLEANEWKIGELDGRLEGAVSDGASVDESVVVEAGATVRSGAVIEGPALIRAGASVGPNAYVRGATLVDRDASIGHAVEVKNSVLFPGATVNHLSYVGDSVLGANVNFGAGTTVANLRHDDEPVRHTVKGERVSTGRRKFGVVVGDGTKTGINTSLAPGVSLDTGSTTYPGEVVDRDR